MAETCRCYVHERLEEIVGLIESGVYTHTDVLAFHARVNLKCGHTAHVVTTGERLAAMRAA